MSVTTPIVILVDEPGLHPLSRLRGTAGFTRRQAEIVLALAVGHNLVTAASELGMTPATARVHFHQACKKVPGLARLAKHGRPRKAGMVEGMSMDLIAG